MVVEFWGKRVKELEMNGEVGGDHGMRILGEESELKDVAEQRGNRVHGSDVARMSRGYWRILLRVVTKMLLRGVTWM